MQETEKTVVLRVGRFREADCWVRFLSSRRGVETAFAFGGCKSVRRFCGCLDPLSVVSFTVSDNRTGSYKTLDEGTLLHSYAGLRKNTTSVGAAVNCTKFLEALEVGPEWAKTAFDLLTGTLHLLEEGRMDAGLVPFFFRAKVAFEQGYAPDFSRCGECGKSVEDFEQHIFHIDRGMVSCPHCRQRSEEVQGGLPVSRGTLRTLDWIRGHEPADWPKLILRKEIRQECSTFIEQFVAWHLGLSWDNGYYRKV
ncbi:MAG: DNA repair protein RecO [Desulfovibrio sp.]